MYMYTLVYFIHIMEQTLSIECRKGRIHSAEFKFDGTPNDFPINECNLLAERFIGVRYGISTDSKAIVDQFLIEGHVPFAKVGLMAELCQWLTAVL